MYCRRSASSPRPRDRVGPIAEERRHVRGGLRYRSRVRREPPPRLRQRGVMVNAGQDVEQRPLGRASRTGRRWSRRPARGTPTRDRRAPGCRLLRRGGSAAAARRTRRRGRTGRRGDRSGRRRRRGRPSSAARPASATRPRVRAVEILERQRAFAFRRAHLHARDQPAEIPIALLAFAEDGQARRAGRAGAGGTDPSSRRSVPALPALPPAPPALAIVSSAPMIGLDAGGASRPCETAARRRRRRDRAAPPPGSRDRRRDRRSLQGATRPARKLKAEAVWSSMYEDTTTSSPPQRTQRTRRSKPQVCSSVSSVSSVVIVISPQSHR